MRIFVCSEVRKGWRNIEFGIFRSNLFLFFQTNQQYWHLPNGCVEEIFLVYRLSVLRPSPAPRLHSRWQKKKKENLHFQHKIQFWARSWKFSDKTTPAEKLQQPFIHGVTNSASKGNSIEIFVKRKMFAIKFRIEMIRIFHVFHVWYMVWREGGGEFNLRIRRIFTFGLTSKSSN